LLLNAEQQERVIDLVAELPWGDVDGAICCLEEALRLALEATDHAFPHWETLAEDIGEEDEFSLTPEQVRDLSPQQRLAYLARLLRTLALTYGVNAGFGDGTHIGQEQPYTPAAILRGLNDISWTPCTPERDVR
jgi:hypothetical protein